MVLDSIIFQYTESHLLNGVYLKIPKGKIVGLYGENGCGKSTLLKIGSGQIKYFEGNIKINGTSYYETKRTKLYKNIGYLPQTSFLPQELTIAQIVRSNNYSEELFKEDDLIGKNYLNKVNTLSGGERRYLEVLLLLNLKREFYLLDEPFSGIEPLIIDRISRLLVHMKSEGAGILITDHFYRNVKEINDVAYILFKGRCRELSMDLIDDELVKYGYKSNRVYNQQLSRTALNDGRYCSPKASS